MPRWATTLVWPHHGVRSACRCCYVRASVLQVTIAYRPLEVFSFASFPSTVILQPMVPDPLFCADTDTMVSASDDDIDFFHGSFASCSCDWSAFKPYVTSAVDLPVTSMTI